MPLTANLGKPRETSARRTVVHVVRWYGGLTESFIEQRVTAAGTASRLWFERAERSPSVSARRIRVPFLKPGSLGDRVFHRLPGLAPLFAGEYGRAEREEMPAVIHAHYLTTGYLVGTRTQSPLVVSSYGFDVTVIPRRLSWRRAIRLLAQRAAAVLVEGPFMRQTVLELGFPERVVQVVPIAVPLEDYSYRSPTATHRPLRLLAVGRLVEKKGHEDAILAFTLARSSLPSGSTLDLVGVGPLRAKLTGLVATLGVADSVRLLGALPRDQYLQRLAEADLMLAPSRWASNGDGEGGAPTTILDAQATGVIVIGSTHADIPFLVDDGRTGFLATEGSADALAQTIERAIANRVDWQGIARRARDQIERRHSHTAVAELLDQIHRKAAR